MGTEQEPPNDATLDTPPEAPEKSADVEAPPPAATPAQDTRFHEKRQSVRHNVRWRALILAGDMKIPVMVVDISDGGLSFAANRSLATNVQMTLAVFVPDAKKPGTYAVSNVTIQVLYQVLSRHEFRFGAKFNTPPAEFLDRVRTAVQRGLS